MEINIDGGRIIDRPVSLRLEADTAQIFGAHCLATGYEVFTKGMSLDDVEAPEMGVILDEVRHDCAVRLLNIGGRGLVVFVPFRDADADETAILYVREGFPDAPWQLATKMLVLPADNPALWGVDDAAFDQRNGRVLQYIALATSNNWFVSA